MGDKNKAVSSFLWSAIDRFFAQIIQFIISIIIARLILPSDSGLIAMLSIFIAIAQTFVDSGFSNALIQKKDRSEVDYSTVFFLNIFISAIAYALLYLSAPYIASFYDIPELELITKVICFNIVISSFGIVQRTRLTILFNFRLQTIISLLSVLISGIIAIIMANLGYGVWALVAQTLISNFINTSLLWFLSKWKPLMRFSKKSFDSLFGFGYKLLLSSLLHAIYSNLYTLVIGKKFTSDDAGLFNRADTFAQFPAINISYIINRVAYPILCDIQDDEERLKHSFLIHLRLSCYIIFPIMILMCTLAQPLVLLLLKENWLDVVPFLQILCIAYLWYPIRVANSQIVNVKGRSDYYLRAEIIKKISGLALLVASIPFGIYMMCVSLIIYSFVDILIMTYYSKKVIGMGIIRQFKEITPNLILGVSLAITTYMIQTIFTLPLYKIMFGILSGIICYIAVSYFLKMKEFFLVKEVIKEKLLIK